MDLFLVLALAFGVAIVGLAFLLLRRLKGRIRSRGRKVRDALGLLATGIVAIPVVGVTLLVTGAFLPIVLPAGILNLVWLEACLAFGLLASIVLVGNSLGSPTLSDVGLRLSGDGHLYRDVGFGLVLGVLMVGLLSVIGTVGGWEKVTGTTQGADLATALGLGAIFCLATALFEEVLYRGCLFGFMSRITGVKAALIISLLVFALLHGLNPGGSVLSIASIFVAGVVLTLGLWRTGRLWLSIGFHTSWNWALASLFGYTVSGIGLPSAIQRQIDSSAPTWVTGGAFGPEASVIGVTTFGLAGAAIWFYTWKRPVLSVQRFGSVRLTIDTRVFPRAHKGSRNYRIAVAAI